MKSNTEILDLVSALKAKGEAFALATVVRTVSVTAVWMVPFPRVGLAAAAPAPPC